MAKQVSSFTIKDNSALFRDASRTVVIRALEAVGNQVVSIAKDNLQDSPMRIDTGLLRNSITHAVSGQSAATSQYSADHGGVTGTYNGAAPSGPENKQAVYIGTNVEYAAYVHEGTRKMAANRFLKRAIEENKGEIEQIVREQFENAPEG